MINLLLFLAVCWILTCVHILDRNFPKNIKVQLLFILTVTGWAGMLYYWAFPHMGKPKFEASKEAKSAILCVDIV